MTSPADLYQQKVANSLVEYNSAQFGVVKLLDNLYWQIIKTTPLKHILTFLKLQQVPLGIYLWGGVGRGKTFLVDLFYESLPQGLALRLHFHHFMHKVHELLTQAQGVVDPLEVVALDFSHYKVLIFDEFYVLDITDAMLLGTLLQKLFKHKVIVVATSNIEPDLLYLNGLQRAKFLPAIAAIKQYCQIVCLDSDIDFRTHTLTTLPVFYCPHTIDTEQALKELFNKLAPCGLSNYILNINERQIQTKMHAANIVWFKFSDLCEGPRGVEDYMQLAKIYDTLIISEVPIFGLNNQDSARRFIELIDELYERKVKLIMSCAANIKELFVQGENSFACERTISRLLEMQSIDYIGLQRTK